MSEAFRPSYVTLCPRMITILRARSSARGVGAAYRAMITHYSIGTGLRQQVPAPGTKILAAAATIGRNPSENLDKSRHDNHSCAGSRESGNGARISGASDKPN